MGSLPFGALPLRGPWQSSGSWSWPSHSIAGLRILVCVFADSFVFAFGLSNDGRALRVCVGAERDSPPVSRDKSVPKLLFSTLNSFVYRFFLVFVVGKMLDL